MQVMRYSCKRSCSEGLERPGGALTRSQNEEEIAAALWDEARVPRGSIFM